MSIFVTVEGIEGSGKTTQMRHIAAYLESRGLACVTTREPGGTAIGEKIRSILLDADNKDMDPVTELLLYTADRAQHIKTFVHSALSSGKIVVCDRYFDATMAYQGYARGLDIDLIDQLHHLVLGGLKPDVTLLLDLSPEIGLARAWSQINSGKRSIDETRFEEETLLFHEKVREGYLTLARNEPGRYRIIDAAKSKEQVRDDIIKVLSEFFN